MDSKKKDPTISALEAVHNALKPLEPAERQRVLSSVYALLDINEAACPSVAFKANWDGPVIEFRPAFPQLPVAGTLNAMGFRNNPAGAA